MNTPKYSATVLLRALALGALGIAAPRVTVLAQTSASITTHVGHVVRPHYSIATDTVLGVAPGTIVPQRCGIGKTFLRLWDVNVVTHDSVALWTGIVSTKVTAPCVAETPVPPPIDTSIATQALAFVGPTIPVARVPAAFSWYESRFTAYADTQWAAFGAKWDAGNSISAYERGATYYAHWARSGDTAYKNRAHQLAVNYRENYLRPNNFATSPHWSQAETMYLDGLVTGDTGSTNAAIRIAYTFAGFDADLDNLKKDWLENRVQTRVLMSWWIAEKLQGKGSQWTALLDKAIPRVLAMQDTSGAWRFPISTCGAELPYMEGMLADLLTRIHDQRPAAYNAAIESAMTKLGNHLWATQWRGPSDLSFNYFSALCAGSGSPTSAPDVNGLILPVFGWLGRTTGDTTWFTRGDQILTGMQRAYLDGYRQFSESYSSSFRYFGYRFPL